jgi:calcineurin-like phosphoesterase family protein
MYKNLYDIFAHWYHEGKGTIYFYSDPHFSDDEMKYLRKNYIGDEEQIKRINSKIGKYDTLVILGDIGDAEWVRKIRGYKVLVMGNHDVGATKYKRKKVSFTYRKEEYTKDELFDAVCQSFPHYNISIKLEKYDFTGGNEFWHVECDNGLFDEVYEGVLMIAPNIVLSHEPIDLPFAVNIHGHDHSNWYQSGINMCAEHINYTPVPLKTLIEKGLLKAPDIHRETIDKAIDRKAKRK